MSAKIDLHFFLSGSEPSNFGYQLFKLISKADGINYGKLRGVFPEQVAIWEEYQRTGKDPIELKPKE